MNLLALPPYTNTLGYTCVALMAITGLILNRKFLLTGKKDQYYPLTLKKFAFYISPIAFLAPMFILAYIHSDDFKNAEVAGKIIAIHNDIRTSFIVGADSIDVPLSFFAKGLASGDSFYKAKNEEDEELDFHYFKKDSLGAFREIVFYPIDNQGTNEWRFK